MIIMLHTIYIAVWDCVLIAVPLINMLSSRSVHVCVCVPKSALGRVCNTHTLIVKTSLSGFDVTAAVVMGVNIIWLAAS